MKRRTLLMLFMTTYVAGCESNATEPALEQRVNFAQLDVGSRFETAILIFSTDGGYPNVCDFNSRGQILLSRYNSASQTFQLSIWEDGYESPLPARNHVWGCPKMNNAGDVVQLAYTPPNQYEVYLLGADGSSRALETVDPDFYGNGFLTLAGFTSREEVLLYTQASTGISSAAMWQSGFYTPMPAAGNRSWWIANQNGVVLASFYDDESASISYLLWQNGIVSSFPMPWADWYLSGPLAFNTVGQYLVATCDYSCATSYLSIFENGIEYILPPPEDATIDAINGFVNDHAQVVGYVRMNDGNQRVALWTHVPPSPSKTIESIGDQVHSLHEAGTLNAGEATAMRMKLNAADQQISRGNTAAAKNQLEAFNKQTAALVHSGRLNHAQGEALASGVRGVISRLD